jgi:hypothetical protein
MPNLVCRYCKTPIYAADSLGYLHANNGSADCVAPQVAGLENRAKPYDNNQTYLAYRAELITEMTDRMFSYADAHSPEELLEMLLADARHFADANGLDFREHNSRSYQIYLKNGTATRGEALQS